MRPVDGPITTDFFEPRSLATVKKLKDLTLSPAERQRLEDLLHDHGAVDLGTMQGTPIKAPESGAVFAWCAYRTAAGIYWPDTPRINGKSNTFRNYFYDTFGGVLILHTDKLTHVITHSYGNQLFNKDIFPDVRYHEEGKQTRFPLHAIYTTPIIVERGDTIGYVGNQGQSTAPHVHWEIHHGRAWERWEDRINPARWAG
ncbi:hypothetical protein LCGC14_1919200 [marine sediment metagenome]|uniref:M23ase beta-sheet core domain-containing protein n=1 Tax=marine sediment metagenome TaxID=412755 RepID=A0A0F9FR45_9ZZZZ